MEEDSGNTHTRFLRMAIALAREGMASGAGGPFGALVVRDGEILARGVNRVTTWLDPTAHAEIVAIREACDRLGHWQLEGCILYTSCEPCPMCLGAIYWARPSGVWFAATRVDAARAGFDDELIYRELPLAPEARAIPMTYIHLEEARALWEDWEVKPDKIMY
jgi:tRNA(Arg) A34 adenosine deaminase TadA